MDSKIKASFIPDKSLNQRSMKQSASAGGIGDLLMLLSVVILAAMIALSAGVFLFDRFLANNVVKKEEQLARAREAFDPILIQDLIRLDSRLNAASDILARHLAPSEVFALLQSFTLQSISYKSLTYSIGEDGVIHIALTGDAQSVNGVALQSSVFGENTAIVNPIFSDLNLTPSGVSFGVSAVLDPLALQYELVAQRRAEAAALPAETPASADAPVSNTDAFGDFSTSTDSGSTQ